MDETQDAVEDTFPAFSADGFSDGDVYAESSPSEEGESVQESQRSRNPRKKTTPSNRRVNELLYERGMLEQNNTFLAAQASEKDALIAEQQRKLKEFQAQLQQKEQLANDYYETSLSEREEAVNRRLKQAIEDGETEANVQLINELADIKAKKNTHQYNQYQQSQRQAEEDQYRQQESYAPVESALQRPKQEPPVSLEFKEWVEDNSWYNNSSRLRQQADTIAQELSDHLEFNNQSQMIGTPEFFNSVSNIMKSRYGKPGQGQSEPEAEDESYEPQQSYNNMSEVVAPVNRRGNNMADQYVQNRGNSNGAKPLSALSKDEYAIARHLPIQKKGEAEMDLVKRYAKAKTYPKSPLPDDNPYRLTIL